MVPSGVAAGHPATVAAGIEILEEGGTAADAAVAACLASCVSETVMTGLLGGGHAIYFDGADAWNLDCFVDVASGEGAAPVELHVPFGEELVHYAVGPGTCAVPGLPRGLGALHQRFGRLPWTRLVGPGAAARARGRRDAAGPRRLPGDARARLHDAARRRAHLRAERTVARGGREARTARSGRGARAARRRGRRKRLRGINRRAADRRRRRPRDGRRSRPLRGTLGSTGGGRMAGAARAHPRRALRACRRRWNGCLASAISTRPRGCTR